MMDHSTIVEIKNALRLLQETIHADNVAAGWWNHPNTGEDLASPANILTTTGWKLLLAHSELSEAAEGFRKDVMDDKLPDRKMAEVELADAVIRIFDLADAWGFDIADALFDKRAYNAVRPDHKKEYRAAAGGKSY